MEIRISEHTCATHGCGISFWMTDAFESRRRKDKGNFYCPNGHPMVYVGESDSEKLARVTQEKNHEINRLAAELREKERLLKKALRKPRIKKIK